MKIHNYFIHFLLVQLLTVLNSKYRTVEKKKYSDGRSRLATPASIAANIGMGNILHLSGGSASQSIFILKQHRNLFLVTN